MRTRARLSTSVIACSTAAVLGVGLFGFPPAAAAPSAKAKCTITGTAGKDRLVGTNGDDVICGRGGDDVLVGKAGDDALRGGRGDDILIGGGGDDDATGGPGDDGVFGGAGEDDLSGGSGNDEVVQGEPLKNDRSWSVYIKPTYDLPKGTKVAWVYELPTGNCLAYWKNWTDTVGQDTGSQEVFRTSQTTPFATCAYERSYGTWTFTVTMPSGAVKLGRMSFNTNIPNAFRWSVDAVCTGLPNGLGCMGGTDAVSSDTCGCYPHIAVVVGRFAPDRMSINRGSTRAPGQD